MAEKTSKWALILGGSTGLGLATASKLARHGFNLLILHRDRRADMVEIEKNFDALEKYGAKVHAFNVDAINSAKILETLPKLSSILKNEKIDLLIHSIAKGNLKPMYSQDTRVLSSLDFQHTINAMGINLYEWTQALVQHELFADDSRIIAFTSEGSTKAWTGYAAVSAAKATLESIVRSMAFEFAPLGIKVNCVQAGITQTRSFQMIPNSEALKLQAKAKNPFKRLTTPEDVANVVYLLTMEEAKWINGTILKVDGGESLQ
ncbi:MAG: SDR family oxidoreductase [Bacteroidota bacterium]